MKLVTEPKKGDMEFFNHAIDTVRGGN